jgi:hypothetical protein
MGNKTEKEVNPWKTKKDEDKFTKFFEEWCALEGVEFDGDEYRTEEGDILEYEELEEVILEDFNNKYKRK